VFNRAADMRGESIEAEPSAAFRPKFTSQCTFPTALFSASISVALGSMLGKEVENLSHDIDHHWSP
jgi:hypothetical protein